VELRSPDGSANVHMLLAGISMAAEWGLTNPKESTKLAEATYVKENIHSHPGLHNLAELPTSCVESAEVLLQHKNLYTRDGIFPENTIQYVAKSLQNENDRNLNKRLLSLPEDERTYESRRIMHRNIHRH
jgi:glutamine synthetase